MEEVCIIGGGISGILSAKISLSYNLIPTIFEKSSSPGGVWQPNSPNMGVWNSLKTNLSKYMMSFSDHFWPPNTPAYPSALEFFNYISSYISKFNLLPYFHPNTIVTRLEKSGESYSVTYQNSKGVFQKLFKYVIVAPGLYARPNDSIKNKEKFVGQVIDAGCYREPSVFSGKNVVVVGRSYSAGDIAYEALETAKSVTQIYRHKVICVRRIAMGFPADFFMFNFGLRDLNPQLPYSLQRNSEFCKGSMQVNGNPGDILEEWRITDQEIETQFVKFLPNTEGYYEAVKSGQIQCIKGNASEYTENGILLDNGQEVPADVVVSATGYTSNKDFLSEDLQELLHYDSKAKKFQMLLFRSCIHPSLPGLAFIGNVPVLVSSLAELSCEIGVRWIKGLLNVSQEELWEGVRLEERLRDELRECDWGYDFIGLQKEFFRLLEIEIDYEMLERLEYRRGPLIPGLAFMEREGRVERIEEWIRQVKEDYPHFMHN